MRRAFLIVTFAACLLGAQPQNQVVNNQSVAEMVKAGVAKDLIVDTINRSECHFLLDPANLVWLKNAGVPDDLVRVMAAKAVGQTPSVSSVPAQVITAPAASRPVSPTPQPPVERVRNTSPSGQDWDFALGTVGAQFGGGLSAGPNRLSRTVSPAISGELNVGMSRYVSLIGDYVYHMLGTTDLYSCSGYSCVFLPIKLRAHEMTGGIKVTIPTSTRFTPFFTGSAGAVRAAAGTSVLGMGISASASAFIGGGGGGFRVNLTRRLALDYDVRLFTGQYGLFYGRTTLGLQVRLN